MGHCLSYIEPGIILEIRSAGKLSVKKYITDADASKAGACQKCLEHANRIFKWPQEAHLMPKLPLHPNCKCHYENVYGYDFVYEKSIVKKALDKTLWNKLVISRGGFFLFQSNQLTSVRKGSYPQYHNNGKDIHCPAADGKVFPDFHGEDRIWHTPGPPDGCTRQNNDPERSFPSPEKEEAPGNNKN